MDFFKPDQHPLLVKKRPPLPKLLKEEIKVACQHIQLIDTNRVLSANRRSARNLKEKLDVSSVFVKRAILSKQVARNSKGSVENAKKNESYFEIIEISIKEQGKVENLQKTLDGKENVSTSDERSSRISTSYSEHGLKIPKILRKPTIPDQNLLKTQIFLRGKLSSKSWIAFDQTSKSVLFEKGSNVKRQMASLTKIMTCLLTLEVMEQLSLDINKLRVIVTQKAASMIGTSAELVAGSELTIKELLYGMMLPSGNDAAYVLAQYIGTLLCLAKTSYQLPEQIHIPSRFLSLRDQTKKCVITFIWQMNRRAGYLGMTRTHYNNPHGLSDKQNYSTCSDLAKLCSYAMQNKQFVQIVTTKQYSCTSHLKEYKWTNTHKLLDEGWHGIKTGVTPAAGPCLASYYKGSKTLKNVNVLVILLGCDTMDLRYQETKLLLQHSIECKMNAN